MILLLFVCFSVPVKDFFTKNPHFPTTINFDQPLLMITSQMCLKKPGDATSEKKKKICSSISHPDAEHPKMSQLFQSLEMNHSHLGLAKRESETTGFKHEEPCHRLAWLLSWLKKQAFSAGDRRYCYYSRQKLMGLSILIQDFSRRREKKDGNRR